MAEQKKKGWFSKIETREDALKVVRDTSTAFFVVAGIQAALSFLLGYSILTDAAIYAAGAFFLRRSNSRIAAVVLLMLAIGSTAVTFVNKTGGNLGGGKNILLALFVLWAAIRAVQATFKLHSQFAGEAAESLRA